MKVRMTCDRAGKNWIDHEGDVIDLCDDEAQRLIAANQAEPAADATDTQLQTATLTKTIRQRRR